MPPRAASSPPPLLPPPPSPPLPPPSSPPLPLPPPADPPLQHIPEVFVVVMLAFGVFLFLSECYTSYARGQRERDDRANRNRGYIARDVERSRWLARANRNRGYITRDVERPRWLRQCVGVATPQFAVVEYRGDERKFDMEGCTICLEDFEEGEQCGMVEECGHAYHESCIKQWLEKQLHCPLCRCMVRVEWAVHVLPASPAYSSSSSDSL